ncbi:MAG TPA: sugar phosphate nucleotidyltransferase [Chitinispirillaceae bacterium]|nr:sugar phosphate nucleotidyltransferase [Chitinispirillaceae bacterium]
MGICWGIIPSAGCGSRIQPLAFSKELLPVGSLTSGDIERPRAVSEYLIERMKIAGVSNICMVISPAKSDILRYYGNGSEGLHFCYTVQQNPKGLCDAIFCALPLISDLDQVIVGLPDTIWFPADSLLELPDNQFSFLLFPVDKPNLYDAVETGKDNRVKFIYVKKEQIKVNWIWGAFKMPGSVMHELYQLWKSGGRGDEYFGTLVNAYLNNGGTAFAIKAGRDYVDVGTLGGYRNAMQMLKNNSTDKI